MVAIIKSREPANILVSIGGRDSQGCHLDRKLRWVVQYNFYLNDRELGPLFIRMCPYFPFPASLSEPAPLDRRATEAIGDSVSEVG